MIYHKFHRRKILVGSVYTAFTSQETFSKLWIIRGMSIVEVKVICIERVFEEGIYYVRLHDVTKHVFFHTEMVCGLYSCDFLLSSQH